MDVIKWDGQPISAPGIYSGVPMSAYHGQLTVGPSASRSGLWAIFDKSPAHYWSRSYLNPDREEPEETDALVLGRAAHHLLLGEPNFNRFFVVRPVEWDSWRTKDAKAWRAAQQKAGMTCLEPKHIDIIKGMARSLAVHPLVRAGVLNGLIEHTMVWRDADTGIWLKIRPDGLPTETADVADLKTAADVTDRGIEKAIGENGLTMQGGMVGMGFREVVKTEMSSFSLVFAEKEEPFCARVKTLKPCDLELGEATCKIALQLMAKCLASGKWPGPGGDQRDAEYIEMAPYARSRIEHRMSVLKQELELA